MTESVETAGESKSGRPWFKKKRWWAFGVLALVIYSVAQSGGSSDTSSSSPSGSSASEAEQDVAESTADTTLSQKNAIRSAENYLSFAPFSRKGLIEQLSSDAGDGYSVADATFAVDSLNVDWNEQAAKAAKKYLEFTSFSRKGLIEQLSSDAGDGYTLEQATYGVNKVGL